MHLGYLILAMVAFRRRQGKRVHDLTGLWRPFVSYNYLVLFFIILYESYVRVWALRGNMGQTGAM